MNQWKWKRVVEGAAVPLVILVLWQTASGLGLVDPKKLPSPIDVLSRWWHYLLPQDSYDPSSGSWFKWLLSGELIHDSLGSLYRIVMGFLIGAGLALPIGLLMGASPRIYRYLNPLFQILRPIPPIAYIPLAILWFGLGNPPAIFLVALGAFFPVLINTIAGVRAVDNIYLRAARNLGASDATVFRRVILPAATPYILSGVRIGIGTAFICVIVAEMIGVGNGLGWRIQEGREYFWTDKVIAGMFSIGLIGFLIDTAMSYVNNHLLRWHRGLES